MRENYKGQRFLHFLIMTHIYTTVNLPGRMTVVYSDDVFFPYYRYPARQVIYQGFTFNILIILC